MSADGGQGISGAARRRTIELLDEPNRCLAESSDAPYIDLLESAPDSTGLTQDLMLTAWVPMVYERWWRPALGRLAKGITGPGMDEEMRIARLLMGLSHGDTVLDVACGPGNFSRAFTPAVAADGLVVGLDASETMLRRGAADTATAGIENLGLVRGNVMAMPFTDGSFDAVCCFAALHLFPEPFDALNEMTRVLAPGGRIALMTSVRRQIAVSPAKPLFERASGMRLFEPEEVVAALQMRGFGEVHQRLSGMVQFVGARLKSD